MSDTKQESLSFQTEVKQLLHLMIHSLYSNKEIFLRELVSNASDACDKLRFQSLKDDSLMAENNDLRIRISVDKDANTVSIEDTGIGMTRDEVVQNLGTIARSGTADFLKNLTGDERKDSQLIGQFGVGFYSSFIVAKAVDVYTRKAGHAAEEGVHWHSEGEGEFTIADAILPARGTKIVLHLKADESEFSDSWRLKNLVKKYSDHISVPVQMLEESYAAAEGEEEEAEKQDPTWENVNSAKALWTRPRSEVNDEEYQELYHHISHDYGDALTWSHNRVEGKLDYTSLLYIPKKAPYDLWNRERVRGLKLYVNRVFIMDDVEQFLPMYLRFVKGIVDSNDLPLNVSREILQNDSTIDSIKSALVKRVLDMLGKLAKKQPEDYQAFWEEFGQVLKEGPAEDMGNKDKIAGLLRFASSHTGDAKQNVSLKDYLERMKEGQDKIYYVSADNHQTAKNSPHLEVFRKKGIEVLLLSDRIDEWLMSYLNEFEGKSFVDVARGGLDLGDIESEEEKQAQEKANDEHKDLLTRIHEQFKDELENVRMTHRLVESPACIVVGDNDMGAQMRRIMEAAGQAVPDSKPILELNPEHPLVQRLEKEENETRFNDLASILLEQARLSEGSTLKDAAGFVSRLNKLLLEMLA
ncbi:molecular chaperone HtpG [Reinekea marinisedimentorum]|uniref:Chaperone protein HtpG n=1 Tax=Reinekea marinisedimentorum TaxID=230495 RepID=A0A4R3I9B3_9GAMM|nr:molecular chaperone HtpG [Reinekea marinisedimentorum]TCS42468.1 molecular chaperone HtpG [Reinekea marinisedimentorum]